MHIVFISYVGTDHEGNHLFDALYSRMPQAVWAEDFPEQVPSSCFIEDLTPKDNVIDAKRRITSPVRFRLACENSCFSMQDCMDGIISLAWAENEDGGYEPLPYGAPIDTADMFFLSHRCALSEITEVDHTKPSSQENGGNGEIMFGDDVTSIYYGNAETQEEEAFETHEKADMDNVILDSDLGKDEEPKKEDKKPLKKGQTSKGRIRTDDDEEVDLEKLFNGDF